MTLRYDHQRTERIGLPEAILCEGKSDDAIAGIAGELAAEATGPVLFTRLSPSRLECLPAHLDLDYDPLSRTAYLNGRMPDREGRVTIVTAGTSDLATAMEAFRTLRFMGISPRLIGDVGVAGLWRLLERVDDLRDCDILIAVAGMDAALASVVGGLVGAPIIGVPTSVGYGAANGGQTALNSMLASCAQGIMVMNIDNGFGAACAAMRILGGVSR